MSVTRYDVMACIDTPAHRWHSVVLASDYDAIEQQCEKLKDALLTSPCARPCQPATDGYGYTTVGACVEAGNCGCDCGAALAASGGEGERK